jgi:hypothetical protein
MVETGMESSSIETNHAGENDIECLSAETRPWENWPLYHKIALELRYNEAYGKAIDII